MNLTIKIGNIYDGIRARFMPDSELKLLKISETAHEYIEVVQIFDKWSPPKWSDFRQNFLIQISDDSDELVDWINDASHLSVDDDIYVISKRDIIRPKGTEFTWKIFCTWSFNKSQMKSL